MKHTALSDRKKCQSLEHSGKCSLLTVPAEALVLL